MKYAQVLALIQIDIKEELLPVPLSEEAKEKLAEEADRRARSTLQELAEALGSRAVLGVGAEGRAAIDADGFQRGHGILIADAALISTTLLRPAAKPVLTGLLPAGNGRVAANYVRCCHL